MAPWDKAQSSQFIAEPPSAVTGQSTEANLLYGLRLVDPMFKLDD